MAAVTSIPSRVFPLPGWTGAIGDHHGISGAVGGSDLMVPSAGTQPVVSMVSGTVEFLSTEQSAPNSGGNAIQIKGIDGLHYYYAHLSNSINLKVGDKVSAGQMFGYAGNSGNAKTTAPHLHIGIGKSIQTGLGPQGGIGTSFNAVDMLRALVKQPTANNPNIANPDTQKDLGSGGVISVPHLSFVPSVAGFDSAHQTDILTNIKEAIAAGVDPFIWLGIVSKESGFDANAKNPTSGAWGYAQIYPCISLSPIDNIKEGLKRYKSFLDGCSGDVNCALNKYSGGAGYTYIADVKGRASKIQGANSDLPTSGDIDTSGDSGGTDTTQGECPKVKIGELPGGSALEIPDFGCELQKAINNLQDQAAQWWKNWQVQNLPNMTFVFLGIALIVVGILIMPQVQSLAMTVVAPEAKAASKAVTP